MSIDIQQEKAVMRREIRDRLKSAAPWSNPQLSAQLRETLLRSQLWTSAASLLLFWPRPDEPDISPLINTAMSLGKRVALPRFVSSDSGYSACEIRDIRLDLAAGRFNIPEPSAACAGIDLKRLDLVLVPGVAFDLHGRRLGRGKGFYDRLLADVRGSTCGVAFDEQIVPRIPVEPHDILLNCILTPTRWLEP